MKATVVDHPLHHHNNNVLGLRGQEGKVHKGKHKEEENEEIKAYLTKLQELVPFMPKNRKLSKLEVIQYVIDYIRDLRMTLGLTPNGARGLPMDLEAMDLMSAAMAPAIPAVPHTGMLSPASASSSSLPPRQPLVMISTPNNSSLNGAPSCASQEIPSLIDKSPSTDVDTRPVSC